MRALAAIRTHEWGEDARRLHARLAPVFGADLAVVFHDRPAGLPLPLPAIDLTDAWLAAEGLVRVADWGWRCGDYSYYALRQARPGYDHYWLIEPDVHFTSDPSGFFDAFRDEDADALGYRLGRFAGRNRFTERLGDLVPHQAIFALTRLSGRAIDRLGHIRRQAAATPVSERSYPNDELFVFSTLAADPAMRLARLEDRAGSWFEAVQFTPDPDLLLDQVAEGAPAGRVYHPVRARASYIRALAGRLANTGVLFRSRAGLRALDDEELEEIATLAAGRMLAGMKDLRGRVARRGRPTGGKA